MNPIEGLRDDILKFVPDIEAEIDASDDETGTWNLDARAGDDAPWIAVEWKADRGFGVSTPGPDDYGTKPDELYPNTKMTLDRVVELIRTGGRTSPPTAVQLAELRTLRGFSQQELAERAGMKQANLSRIETRDDVKLSTLSRIVAAMGGATSIHVTFPDGSSYRVSVGQGAKPVENPKAVAPPRKRSVADSVSRRSPQQGSPKRREHKN